VKEKPGPPSGHGPYQDNVSTSLKVTPRQLNKLLFLTRGEKALFASRKKEKVVTKRTEEKPGQLFHKGSSQLVETVRHSIKERGRVKERGGGGGDSRSQRVNFGHTEWGCKKK